MRNVRLMYYRDREEVSEIPRNPSLSRWYTFHTKFNCSLYSSV